MLNNREQLDASLPRMETSDEALFRWEIEEFKYQVAAFEASVDEMAVLGLPIMPYVDNHLTDELPLLKP